MSQALAKAPEKARVSRSQLVSVRGKTGEDIPHEALNFKTVLELSDCRVSVLGIELQFVKQQPVARNEPATCAVKWRLNYDHTIVRTYPQGDRASRLVEDFCELAEPLFGCRRDNGA